MLDVPARQRLIKITVCLDQIPKANPVSACRLQRKVHLARLVFQEQVDVRIDCLAVVDAKSQILHIITFIAPHQDVSTISPHDAAIFSLQKRLSSIQNIAL